MEMRDDPATESNLYLSYTCPKCYPLNHVFPCSQEYICPFLLPPGSEQHEVLLFGSIKKEYFRLVTITSANRKIEKLYSNIGTIG